MSDVTPLVDPLLALARQAGEAEMVIYNSDFEVETKDDTSPVTAADQEAERLILAGLKEITPELPVVAEESVAAGVIPDVSGGRFWLVDPLDGTKEFIRRNGEFTVNIALVEHGQPILGVVHTPALGVTYWGYTDAGTGFAFVQEGDAPRRPLRTRAVPPEGYAVVASRSHGAGPELDAFLADKKVAGMVNAGSSLKFCLVAAGKADVYPRFGRTMEWDIAAGHAVLQAAGGAVTTSELAPMRYNKPGFENPHFIAWGHP